jgi:hypothetical protein
MKLDAQADVGMFKGNHTRTYCQGEWKQCLSALSALASSDAAMDAKCALRALDYVFAMQVPTMYTCLICMYMCMYVH